MLKLPDGFIQKYRQLLGDEEAKRLFIALQNSAKKAFRVNTLKKEHHISYSTSKVVPIIPDAYYGEINGQDAEWVSGMVYSQDPAAMFPAYLAKVQPGEKVLDLCAAPGGKTTALGESLHGKGVLVANEISSSRVKVLRENVERWGLANTLITNETPEKLALTFPSFFDKIIVDAPCSGEGMFRKSSQAIEYWSQDYVLTCQKRQKQILKEALKMLKPGGKLIYSTCTFSPEEDEQIVAWLVNNYQMKIIDANLNSKYISYGHPAWTQDKLPALNNTYRFWPQDNLGEGQFAAILSLPGNDKVNESLKKVTKKKSKRNKSGLTKDDQKLIAQVLDYFDLPKVIENWRDTTLIHNDHIFIPAVDPRILKKLHIISNGIELGILKKNRFEPGHQLAQVLATAAQKRTIELSDYNAFKKYLHGETIKVNSNLRGFVLVQEDGLIFSFGKITGNGILKNFYPKGLRI